VMRGINRQDIFYDEDDYQRFMGTLERLKTDKFEVYGYCLMSNHVHLLIREKSEEIPQIMKRIGTSYAWWYNRKYQRTGQVFQDVDEILRRSKVIEGATQRQIARVTGLNQNIVFKA
jgi:putative transposase